MTSPFALDPLIAEATVPLGETALTLVLMMNDRRFPWVVLVPRRMGAVELFDLAADDRHRLVDEASAIARGMALEFAATKINVATLGNRVCQLHLHVIARREGDAAWPDGVWNGTPAVPYAPADRDAMRDTLRGCLAGLT